jgi:hypothetical protein
MVFTGSVDKKGRITLVASDLRRITYAADGKPIETSQMPMPGEGEALMGLNVVGSEVFLMFAKNAASDTALNATMKRLSSDGHSYDSLFSVHLEVPTLNRMGGMPIQLFRTTPYITVDDVHDVYLADPDKYVVTRYNERGNLLSTLTVDVKPAPVTPAVLEAFTNRPRPQMRGGPSAKSDAYANSEFDRQVTEAIRNAPRVMPVIDRLMVLSDRSVWLRRYAMKGADSARWDGFTTDGRRVGSTTLSGDAEIRAGSAARLLIMSKDSLDIPVLRWYSVSR